MSFVDDQGDDSVKLPAIVENRVGQGLVVTVATSIVESPTEGAWNTLATGDAPWLFILLGLGILVSSMIGVLSSLAFGLVMVFSFQSLILDMTGNSGRSRDGDNLRTVRRRNNDADGSSATPDTLSRRQNARRQPRQNDAE